MPLPSAHSAQHRKWMGPPVADTPGLQQLIWWPGIQLLQQRDSPCRPTQFSRIPLLTGCPQHLPSLAQRRLSTKKQRRPAGGTWPQLPNEACSHACVAVIPQLVMWSSVCLSYTNCPPTQTPRRFSENPKWDGPGVKSECSKLETPPQLLASILTSKP